MISAEWSANFQMVLLFYMSLSSVCLFSIRQLRELLAKISALDFLANLSFSCLSVGKSEPEQLFNFRLTLSINP